MGDAIVLTAKDLEDACKQSVAVIAALSILIMLPIKTIGLYAFFVKLEKMFNPHRIRAHVRRQAYARNSTTE